MEKVVSQEDHRYTLFDIFETQQYSVVVWVLFVLEWIDLEAYEAYNMFDYIKKIQRVEWIFYNQV